MDHSIINVWQQTDNSVRPLALLLWLKLRLFDKLPPPKDVSSMNHVRGTTLLPRQILVLIFMMTFLANYASTHMVFLMEKAFWTSAMLSLVGILFTCLVWYKCMLITLFAAWKQIGLVTGYAEVGLRHSRAHDESLRSELQCLRTIYNI